MRKKTVERVPSLELATYAVAIKNALRRCGFYLRSQRVDRAVGLGLPQDGQMEIYREAAKTVLRQDNALVHYVVTSIELGRKGETYCEDSQKVLSQKCGAVVLIEKGAKLSPEIVVALDRVVDVGLVRPFHLMFAAKNAWGTDIPPDVARQLCAYPPALLFGALRRGRSLDMVLEKLRTASSVPKPSAWEPCIEELEGYGDAKEWALSLVVDLSAWRDGRITWRDVDAGLLLSGPPGTGKTLFASALARSCGANFIGTSSAQWQSKGHLGDMLGAMRKSFRDASEKAPTVLFIDEIDAIGDRRSFSGDNASYSMQVVNALLELLDGSDARDGVIVIAASNYPDHLDPALRRPGRLDRHIEIGLPDSSARAQMLVMHLNLEAPGSIESLQDAVRATSGYSGAAIAQVAKNARRIARRQGREVAVSDVLALVPPVAIIDGTERWSACIHEAGHAVVGLELTVGEIEMIYVAHQVGHLDRSFGHVQWRRKVTRTRSRQSYLDEIAMLLGGMAAEQVILGDVFDGSGGGEGSDLQRAADLATVMLSNLGLSSLHYCDISTQKEFDDLRRSDAILRRRVERLLSAELKRASMIVSERRAEIDQLAYLLVESGLLRGQEIAKFFTPRGRSE
ncbi:AAA family ATPase [Agrobacterium vitis]